MEFKVSIEGQTLSFNCGVFTYYGLIDNNETAKKNLTVLLSRLIVTLHKTLWHTCKYQVGISDKRAKTANSDFMVAEGFQDMAQLFINSIGYIAAGNRQSDAKSTNVSAIVKSQPSESLQDYEDIVIEYIAFYNNQFSNLHLDGEEMYELLYDTKKILPKGLHDYSQRVKTDSLTGIEISEFNVHSYYGTVKAAVDFLSLFNLVFKFNCFNKLSTIEATRNLLATIWLIDKVLSKNFRTYYVAETRYTQKLRLKLAKQLVDLNKREILIEEVTKFVEGNKATEAEDKKTLRKTAKKVFAENVEKLESAETAEIAETTETVDAVETVDALTGTAADELNTEMDNNPFGDLMNGLDLDDLG